MGRRDNDRDCDHWDKDYRHVYLPGGVVECGRCGAELAGSPEGDGV